MKAYYYLLYRLYDYYNRVRKENAGLSIYFTITASTIILYFLGYTALAIIDFYFVKVLTDIITSKILIISLLLVVAFLNYWIFIKDKKFLTFNFHNDREGGYIIIGFILLLALSFLFIANKNREKNFRNLEKMKIEAKQ